MRLTAPGAARNAFTDRNPLNVSGLASLVSAPLTNVTEWTYTVPTARKAMLGGVGAHVTRVSVATTAVSSQTTIALAISGGLVGQLIRTFLQGNVIGNLDRETLGGGTILQVGDNIKMVANSTDTGGTNEYCGNALMTEFDA